MGGSLWTIGSPEVTRPRPWGAACYTHLPAGSGLTVDDPRRRAQFRRSTHPLGSNPVATATKGTLWRENAAGGLGLAE